MPIIPTFHRTFEPSASDFVKNTSKQTNVALGGVAEELNAVGIQQQRAEDATWFNENDIAMRKQVMDEQQQFLNQYQDNPTQARDSWDTRLREIRDDFASRAPSDSARTLFTNAADRYREQELLQTDTWARNTQINTFADRTDRAAQDLYNLAYREPTLANLSDLAVKAEQSVSAGSTFMAPDKLAEMGRTMRANLAKSTLEGMFSGDQATTAKKLLMGGKFDGYLDAADVQRYHQQAVNAERAQKARQLAAQSQAVATAGVEVDSILDRMKKGYAIPKEDMDAAERLVGMVGESSFSRKFEAIKQVNTFQQQLRAEPPARLEEIVQKLEAKASGAEPGGINATDATKLEVAQGFLGEIKKGMKADPIATVSGLGAIKINPLVLTPAGDAGDTAPMLDSLKQRAQAFASARQMYGASMDRVFSGEEANQIAGIIGSLDPKQKLTYGTMIAEGLGAAAPTAFQQIAADDPVFAHAAGLSEYNPVAAAAALEGAHIAQNNPNYAVEKDGSIKATLPVFQSASGATFSAIPEYAAAVKKAADAIYIREASRQGLSMDSIDSDLYARSLNMAVGGDGKDTAETGLVEIGGGWFDGQTSQKIILPPGINRTSFQNYLASLDRFGELKNSSMGGIGPMDSRGNPIKIMDALREGSLMQLGNGAYTIRMPDGNLLRGGGPSGEYVLLADPARINRVLSTKYFTTPPVRKPFTEPSVGGYR